MISIAVIIPSIVLIAIFVYGFIAWTGYASLTDANTRQQLSINQEPPEFVGMEQYEELFTRRTTERFREGLTNVVFFTVLFIASCLGIGVLLAILLDQKVVGEALFRAIFLFPMALSFVVTGVVWKWLFQTDSGINVLLGVPEGRRFSWFISQEQVLQFNWQDMFPIVTYIILGVVSVIALWLWLKNSRRAAAYAAVIAGALALLSLLGVPQQLPTTERPELQGFNIALVAVVIAATWQMSGYTMAMYLAGLRGISEELREAARVDGASEFGVYRRIILPLLAPITLSAIIILGHISLKIFDLVYVMGNGGVQEIDMPGVYIYQTAFRGTDIARGGAVAIILLLLVATVIVPYLVSSLRGSKTA